MERAQLGLRTAEIAVGADTVTPGQPPDPTTTPTTLIDRNRRLMLHSLCQLNSGQSLTRIRRSARPDAERVNRDGAAQMKRAPVLC
jgi:hypothetical protein